MRTVAHKGSSVPGSVSLSWRKLTLWVPLDNAIGNPVLLLLFFSWNAVSRAAEFRSVNSWVPFDDVIGTLCCCCWLFWCEKNISVSFGV